MSNMSRYELPGTHEHTPLRAQSASGATPASDRASRQLHPAAARGGQPLDTSVLRDIAAGLAAVAPLDEPAEPWTLGSTRVLATEAYDAWVMVWGPAALSEAHDHDGSVGVVQIVQGQLLETSLALDGTQPSPLRRLGPGDTVECAAAQFHTLFNPTSATTVTVNVYSPPLGDAVAHD